jgi:hypothetical protein
MIDESELYTQASEQPLEYEVEDPKKKEKVKTLYGTVYTRYEVRQVMDVRNLEHVRRYRITCTQRVVIPTKEKFELTPIKEPNFDGYPALLTSRFSLVAQPSSEVRLLNYSPRTMNTTITTSTNQGQGANQSISRQHTSGSSTAETNTYGSSASFGFFGLDPTGSLSSDQSKSSSSERYSSAAAGREWGASTEHGDSDSMSLKDWSSYAVLDRDNKTPTWVWGQEYPWDLIQYRFCPAGNVVKLPDFVKARMFDDTAELVLPPSQLSMFGIDFTMKAAWLVDLPKVIGEQSVRIDHQLRYLTASHGLNGKDKYAYINGPAIPFELKSPGLELTLLGLDPIRNGSVRNGAVIGFIASKFVSPPPSAGHQFKIISEGNTLQVTGQGFDSAMQTSFGSGEVKLHVQFKIVDTRFPYALFMKHWKTTVRGCMLTFVFNKDESTRVTRHVDWKEGEGGEENLSSIVMRNRDYTSIDYHDYLVMGLNTVDIIIAPSEGDGPAGYLLRALAIGVQ